MPKPSKPIRVLAVDPGERVGWATGYINPAVFKVPRNEIMDSRPVEQIVREDGPLPKSGQSYREGHTLTIDAHGIDFLKDAALAIHRGVAVERRYDVVIYETFLLTAKGAKVMVGSDLQTAQFVGMVRLAAWLNPDVQLVPQGPAAKSSAMKSLRCGHPSAADIQERIRKLPKDHDSAHDGDALMHAWSFFFERYV